MASARLARPLLIATLLLSACSSGDDDGPGSGPPAAPGGLPAQAQCVIDNAYRQVGAGLDAPSQRLEVPVPAAAKVTGSCAGNQQFRFGSGLYDITGPVANTSGMGWESPTQVLSGLHQRQYARAFAVESPCNGKRLVFVSTDTGMVFGTVRQNVLARIAADPQLSAAYGPDNVMLGATHTHNGPAGYSHYEAYNLFHVGFDQLVLDTIAGGIYQAIKLAHSNLAAQGAGNIRLAIGELLNTNLNRSKPAFALNNEADRREFLNARGEEVLVDKRVVQLDFLRNNGSAVGTIHWFGVHPTVIGPTQILVSSDNKGYASLGFEKLMKARYDSDGRRDSFVAAFAQAAEGDSSPNIFIEQFPHPDPARGGGADDYESNAISGTKHLASALELYGTGTPLTGPVDYRFFHVKMDAVTVNDPVVLAAMGHPAELDAPVKRTCLAALGVSFGAGAEDGPGPTVEGVSCKSSPDVIAAATADFMAASAGKIPPSLAATTVLCQLDQQPLLDLSCHAEKPVLFAIGPPLSAEPNILPLQIIRIGNLAVVGLPWEVTTMSARRIRKLMYELLAPAGVDTIVVASLVNDFVHYLTTREEYASQQYEGGSNIFGPWTLSAVQQELRKLATSLRDGSAAPQGPAYVDAVPKLIRPPYIPSDLPGSGGSFGALVSDVPATAAPGDTVRAEWQAGHPRNDLRTQQSYLYAERQRADGSWEVVAEDRDPNLRFFWHPMIPSPLPVDPPVIGPSTAEAMWIIPRDTIPGIYRLRHVGAAKTLLLPLQAYEGVSSPFTIAGAVSACP